MLSSDKPICPSSLHMKIRILRPLFSSQGNCFTKMVKERNFQSSSIICAVRQMQVSAEYSHVQRSVVIEHDPLETACTIIVRSFNSNRDRYLKQLIINHSSQAIGNNFCLKEESQKQNCNYTISTSREIVVGHDKLSDTLTRPYEEPIFINSCASSLNPSPKKLIQSHPIVSFGNKCFYRLWLQMVANLQHRIGHIF